MGLRMGAPRRWWCPKDADAMKKNSRKFCFILDAGRPQTDIRIKWNC